MKKTDFQFTGKEWLAILMVSFGYFVDLYDLYLFSIVRTQSLRDLGISDAQELIDTGTYLINWQLGGLLAGGILWGLLADKKGRLFILFGSIATYTIANIASGFVQTVPSYAFWRFIAGLGLAGELGVGLTLLSENLPRNKRTVATMIVTATGLLGVVVSAKIASVLDWRTCYMVGGGIGILLLLIRWKANESHLFKRLKTNVVQSEPASSIFPILFRKKVLLRLFLFILVGAPVLIYPWIFITFSPEFGKTMGITQPISVSTAIITFFIAMTVADVAGNMISKIIRSRKKVLLGFAIFQFIAAYIFLFVWPETLFWFYFRCALIGIGIGYWGVLVTAAIESVGTNLRATTGTIVTNFIRAFLLLANTVFSALHKNIGIVYAGAIVVAIFATIGLIALVFVPDKFENELDFIEEKENKETVEINIA